MYLCAAKPRGSLTVRQTGDDLSASYMLAAVVGVFVYRTKTATRHTRTWSS
jgi:hypothetical protein